MLVGRNKDKLEEVREKIDGSSTIIVCDLAKITSYEQVETTFASLKKLNIGILVNNAGTSI